MVTQDELRAGDADRDAALELLREAYSEGRLDRAEFEDRSSSMLAARTYGDVAALLADLPVASDRLPAPPHRPQVGSTRARTTKAGGSRTPAVARRQRQTAAQRQRSMVASVIALMVVLTGGAVMATAPVTDVYADSYPAGGQYDAFGAIPISEIAMLAAGSHVGYEVLRHDGPASVLTVTAATPDAYLVVRVDDDGVTRTSGYGSVSVLLPAGSQAVEVDADAEWAYEQRPMPEQDGAP